jgi:hypothetical protein
VKRVEGLVLLLIIMGFGIFTGKADSGPSVQEGITYTLTETDSSGRVTSCSTNPSHSYLIGFLQLLYTPLSQTSVTFKDINGLTKTGSTRSTNFQMDGAAGNTNLGIVAGTGTTAVAQTDYHLQTLIAQGSGSGQLSYGSETFTQAQTVGSTTSFTTSRTLANNSGASITINEIGIYAYFYSGGSCYICIIRDVLASGQTIESGHNLTITYTFATTH